MQMRSGCVCGSFVVGVQKSKRQVLRRRTDGGWCEPQARTLLHFRFKTHDRWASHLACVQNGLHWVPYTLGCYG